jgi:ABC-2 type transport system ATP-binding protein
MSVSTQTPAVEVEGVVRRFDDLIAVDGISFSVRAGEIFGFLGPNGAGKSTTIKILCTLLYPSAGHARVAGYDVVAEPAKVRRSLGLLFQDPSVDDRLTARENLRVHCMIYGVPRPERRGRIEDALTWIGLVEEADQRVRTFSGGMRRRLEVARALLHRPRILFLDEPTTGLDPQTRRSMWARLHELRQRDNMTIFLTTHYMDEAENCDRLAIIDHGKLIAEGSPNELKRRAGEDRVTLSTVDDARAAQELHTRLGYEPQRTERGIEFAVGSGEKLLAELVGFPVEVRRLNLQKPTLEDAFIALTGHSIRPDEASARDVLRRMVRMRRRS